MPIRLRGNTYWIDLRHPVTGRRIRQTTGTSREDEAQELHDKIKHELWAEDKFDKARSPLLIEAITKWCGEHPGKKSLHDDVLRLEWISKRIGTLPLNRITRQVIENLIEEKQQEVWQGSKVSNATVNRTLSALSTVLGSSVAWGWLKERPHIRRLKEAKGRDAQFSRDQIVTMVSLLPLHQAEVFCFALATGQRAGNILGLMWDKVDVTRRCFWIESKDFKSGHALNVPLSDEALTILAQRWGSGDAPQHPYVFASPRGKRITRLTDQSWYTALLAAGLKGMRFHDTRHTWASQHTMAGTPPQVLQALGGWQDRRMVDRYSHLAPNFAASFAENAKLK